MNDFDLLLDTIGRNRALQGRTPLDFSAATEAANKLVIRIDAIEKDPLLSPAGRQAEKIKAGREALAGLQKWSGPRLANLRENEAQVRADLTATVTRKRPTEPAAAIADALTRAEIRRAAEKMTDSEVELLFRNGDGLVRDALLEGVPKITVKNGAVFVKPYVPAELVDETVMEVAQQLRPDLAASIENLMEIAGTCRAVEAGVTSMVKKLAPGAVPEGGRIQVS